MATIDGIGFNTKDVGGDLSKLATELDRAEVLGCEMMEITAVGLDAVTACRLVPDRVGKVKEILSRHQLTYSLHAPIAVDLMAEAELELHKHAAVASLELAAEIGATTIVIHPGRADPDVWARDADRLLTLEADALAELADRAAALGVVIAYENISPNPRVIAGLETSYSLDPRQLAAQLDRVGHPALIACLDVSHAQQGAKLWDFDMIEACRALSPHIGHLHYSDSTGAPARIDWRTLGEMHFFGVGDMHAPAGWGLIDFDALASALQVREGSRIVIELKSNFLHHSAEMTLAAARRFAAQLGRSNETYARAQAPAA